MPMHVLIGGKRILARGIVEENAPFRSDNVVEDRLWHIRSGYARLLEINCHHITAGRGLRLYSQLITSRKNQQTSLSARVLNRGAHECVDQSLQHDLAGHCL